MTKREFYDVVNAVFMGIEHEGKEDVLNICEKEVAALDRKNEKARERAAAKKEAGDALKEAIFNMLSDEPMTINDIVAKLDNPEITRNKVVARMTQLIRDERAAKDYIKIDKNKVVAYTAR